MSRLAVPLCVAVTLLAACAGSGPTATDTAAQPLPTAATASEAGTDPSAGSTTVETAFGPVEVPAEPQRVAVLNVIAVDATHLVGVEPLVVPVGTGELDLDALGDVEQVQRGEIDVEALAVLEPDVILDGAFEGELFSGLDYDVLSDVAPVVAFDFLDDTQWKEYLAFFAPAIGRTAQAQEVLAGYDEQVEELATAVADRGDEPTVSVVRVLPDQIGNYSQVGFAASILDDVGIATIDSDAGSPDTGFLSLERTSELDADHLYYFVTTNDDEGQAAVAAFLAEPIWQQLGAVQAGNAHAVEAGAWFGFGPNEALVVLDDLQRTLTGDDNAGSS